jgi:hypothetical protein
VPSQTVAALAVSPLTIQVPKPGGHSQETVGPPHSDRAGPATREACPMQRDRLPISTAAADPTVGTQNRGGEKGMGSYRFLRTDPSTLPRFFLRRKTVGPEKTR